MDIGCSCICSTDYDPAKVYKSKIITARKQHTCCECGETIEPGERYENTSGLWDNQWSHYKTCSICLCIREDLCCDGWIFETLRTTIWEEFGLDYVTGETIDDEE